MCAITKHSKLRVYYIIVLVVTISLCSCKTYYVSVDGLKQQFNGIDSTQFKEVAVKGPLGEIYRYKANPISSIKCVDNKNNPSELTNSPSIEMRVTHNGQRTIFYFDRVYVNDSLLMGVESRFVQTVSKNIPLNEISKIEVQDGRKKFRYIEN